MKPPVRCMRALLCSVLLGLLCGVVQADALDDAMNARNRGDYAAALVQLRPLANAGNAAAAFQLSLLYANGLGVRADAREAVRWLRTAAAQGNPEAQTNLGVAYAKGRGVVQDDSRAYVWFSLAAAGGDTVAQTNRDLAARKLNAQQMKQATALLAQCQGPHWDVCL